MNNKFKIKLFLFSVILLKITISAYAQSNYWPEEFSISDSISVDSTKRPTLSSENKITYSEIFKNENTYNLYNKKNGYAYQQQLYYLITDYNNSIINQCADLSGKIIKEKLLFNYGDLGFDWTPGVYYYKSKNDGIFQVPVDIGPIMNLYMGSIPLEVRSGISAYGWNDEFHPHSGMLAGNYHAKTGYYGGISIGDTLHHLLGFPLVANVSALGKTIGNRSLGVIKSSLKSVIEFGQGDSLFMLFGDSLSNGKQLYGLGANTTLYSTVPWKIEHKLSFSGAVKGREFLSLKPGIIYSFSQKTIKYPSQPDRLDNVKANKNSLGLLLLSTEEKVLSYNGGVSFTWDNTDWIYNESSSEIKNDSTDNKKAANLGDCREYSALTDHELLLRMPLGFSLNYQLHAMRDSKKYPYTYTSGGTLVTNENEGDRVRILNHGGLLFEHDTSKSFEIFTEYAKNYIYYYRKARSGESLDRDEYKVGFNVDITMGKLHIGENAFAESERSDYKFKSVHIKGTTYDPPPYSRKVSSLMLGSWSINERWTVTGKWNEIYYDNGKWYAKAYTDSTHTRVGYAIENKSIDYSVELSACYTNGNSQLEGGLLLLDSDLRYFDVTSNTFVREDLGKGYILEPSLEWKYLHSKIIISSKIARKFNTLDDEKWNIEKNWDISLLLKMKF